MAQAHVSDILYTAFPWTKCSHLWTWRNDSSPDKTFNPNFFNRLTLLPSAVVLYFWCKNGLKLTGIYSKSLNDVLKNNFWYSLSMPNTRIVFTVVEKKAAINFWVCTCLWRQWLLNFTDFSAEFGLQSKAYCGGTAQVAALLSKSRVKKTITILTHIYLSYLHT